MEDVTIIQARFIAFLEIVDLDPKGQLHWPDFFPALVEHYAFQKFPQKYEEFDLQKGIALADGKWEGGHINKVEIYPGGIAVDTRSSNEDSERLFHECLTWAAMKFGLQYHQKMIKRKAYVSQLMFHSDAPIFSALSGSLSRLAEKVTQAVEQSYGERINYEPFSFSFHCDQTTRQLSPTAFGVSRRLGVPFTENKYFSEAPLPTRLHEELLRTFDADLTR